MFEDKVEAHTGTTARIEDCREGVIKTVGVPTDVRGVEFQATAGSENISWINRKMIAPDDRLTNKDTWARVIYEEMTTFGTFLEQIS